MGTAYAGLRANVVPPGALAISSSVAGNPTTINTTAVHGLSTGDYVDIFNHNTNTPANCVNQPVTVTSATQFTIPINSGGFGSGGASGFVVPLQFTGNVGLNPANGDALSAATWIPGMSCTQDRTSYLFTATGAYLNAGERILGSKATDSNFGVNWFTGTFTFNGYNFLAGGPFGPINAISTDFIEIEFNWTVGLASASPHAAFALFYCFVATGTAASGFAPILTSEIEYSFGSSVVLPATMRGYIGGPFAAVNPLTIGAPLTVGQVYFALYCNTFNATQTISGLGNYVAKSRTWRTTGVTPAT